jgi:hypothetical protein
MLHLCLRNDDATEPHLGVVLCLVVELLFFQ